MRAFLQHWERDAEEQEWLIQVLPGVREGMRFLTEERFLRIVTVKVLDSDNSAVTSLLTNPRQTVFLGHPADSQQWLSGHSDQNYRRQSER